MYCRSIFVNGTQKEEVRKADLIKTASNGFHVRLVFASLYVYYSSGRYALSAYFSPRAPVSRLRTQRGSASTPCRLG